ncbi:type II secretion system protein [Falsibacillus pallidus]|uniref:Type IV pilus assembly protein PilA n=1 Tax=Falsibacillus pallidus TaxID=493781 RepID=A0A370GKI1_9BACI|nr:type II secretion system protein [Falsibacillus pallidus]RDI44157.1 type IV pilus assembly protein PilA [Falsibacillus pallidus]
MLKRIKALKNQKGFTLVELLAVIVILGIIAAIAVPSIGGIIDKSKADAHRANALQIISAAKIAVAANDSTIIVPSTPSVKQLVDGGYLDAIPGDPDNDKKAYDGTNSKVLIVKKGNAITYSITLKPSAKSGSSKTYYDNASEADIISGKKPATRN